jgi:hypothetical protein
MLKNNCRRILPLLVLLLFTVNIAAQLHPRTFNERFVGRAVVTIHGAQMTFAATSGNRNFGSLAELGAHGLIDAALAEGEKYGYVFTVRTTPWTPSTPPAFVVTAVPRLYRKNGIRSFYVDTSGSVREADKAGALADASDPEADFCPLYGFYGNEPCSLWIMRLLHGAQMTYATTIGNRNYGTLEQLGSGGYIDETIAGGTYRGYLYRVEKIDRVPWQSEASFKIFATPQIYGITGTRSFFIATDGILHGADKHGNAADENDPPLDN